MSYNYLTNVRSQNIDIIVVFLLYATKEQNIKFWRQKIGPLITFQFTYFWSAFFLQAEHVIYTSYNLCQFRSTFLKLFTHCRAFRHGNKRKPVKETCNYRSVFCSGTRSSGSSSSSFLLLETSIKVHASDQYYKKRTAHRLRDRTSARAKKPQPITSLTEKHVNYWQLILNTGDRGTRRES